MRICHDRGLAEKHLTSLRAAYGKAPFFEDHEGFLREVFLEGFERIADLNVRIILYLVAAFAIPTRVVRLSDLRADGREPHYELPLHIMSRPVESSPIRPPSGP